MANKKFQSIVSTKAFTPLNRIPLAGNLTGFTLVEVLIVLGIILVLAAVSLPLIGNWPLQTKITDAQTALVQDLRLVRQKSLAGAGGQNHGIKFFNDGYVMFQGDSYANRQPDYDLSVSLAKSADLTWQLTGDGQPDEIVFAQGTGLPSRLGRLTLNSGATQVTIGFNRLGLSCTPECANRCAGDDDGCDSTCSTACAWQTVGAPGFSDGKIEFGALAYSGSIPYMAYADYNCGGKLTVKQYDGTAWNNLGPACLTATQAIAINLAVDNNTPYVAFIGSYPYKVSVKRYDGSAWVNVGTPDFAAVTPNLISLAVVNGTPYVAYGSAVGSKVSVMKYDGTNWVYVGAANFSDSVMTLRLSVVNNTPYVLYSDWAQSGKTTLMTYNGTAWVSVGNPGFSVSNTANAVLFMAGATPYVAYTDWAQAGKATVMKYDGSAWVNVGTPGFSADSVAHLSLFVDGDLPYLAFQDNSLNLKTTVMKFNGSVWTTIGSAGFSAGESRWNSLAVINGTAYVGYKDYGYSEKAVVQKFAP